VLSRKLILSFIAVSVLSSFSFVVSVEADSSMWSQTYGGIEEEGAHAVIETFDGGYAMVGGARLFKTDEFGNMEWNQTYGSGGSSLVQTDDGGYAIARGNRLFKTNSTGYTEWNQTYGDGSAASLVATSDGGYAISGSAPDGNGWGDFWLVKTDASGNMEWNQTYGGISDDVARSLVATSDGGYALAGYTKSFGAGSYDCWLVKTNEFGIVPEYSSWLILSLLLTATLFIVIYKKKFFDDHP
jgi:hypothetical protein